MVELKKVFGEFPLPKVRQSFTRQFAEDSTLAYSSHSEGLRFFASQCHRTKLFSQAVLALDVLLIFYNVTLLA